MADHVIPHFQNDAGVPVIEVGSKEFMCIGARPPFDHPHVFCDMGDDTEIICEYCSTLFRYDPSSIRTHRGRRNARGRTRGRPDPALTRGADLTFATHPPRARQANVKSQAPLESILASGPLILTFAKSLPRRDANVRIGPLGGLIANHPDWRCRYWRIDGSAGACSPRLPDHHC